MYSTINLEHRENAVNEINSMRLRGLNGREIIKALNAKGFTHANRRINKAAILQLSAPAYIKNKSIIVYIESLRQLITTVQPSPPKHKMERVSLFFLSLEEIKVIRRWIQVEFKKIVSEASIKKLIQYHYQREIIQEVIIESRKRIKLEPVKGQESSNSDTSKPTETKRMMILLTNKHRDWLRHKAYKEDTQMSKIIRELLDNAILEENLT